MDNIDYDKINKITVSEGNNKVEYDKIMKISELNELDETTKEAFLNQLKVAKDTSSNGEEYLEKLMNIREYLLTEDSPKSKSAGLLLENHLDKMVEFFSEHKK